METIYIAVISITSIGAFCAAVLCIASKMMYVKVDERLAQIEELLPGANCGACGYPGCTGYANALIAGGDVSISLCTPGGEAVLKKLSEFLGIAAGEIIQKSAIVLCCGDKQQKKMNYAGIKTCAAAKELFCGEAACTAGCMGYGDCKAVCPFGAVCLENNLARINTRLCTGCGLCIKACPNNIISAENSGIAVAVLCKNTEKGAIVRKKCSKGCIGCGKCACKCPAMAITMEDNLAIIDYDKCTSFQRALASEGKQNCTHCADKCVTGCIRSFF